MSKINSTNQSGFDAQSFPSIAALKSAHTDLLKQYREVLGAHGVHDDNGSRLLDLLPEIKNFIERGRETGALIDAEEDRAASQTFLDYWVSIIYRAGLSLDDSTRFEATLVDFNPDLSPTIAENLCPYIGLDTFQEQNQNIFYGRKTLTEEMLKKLDAGPLLAVVGPSGSGKSSAVLAGLLPALKAGQLQASSKWNYFPQMVPGANPLRNLAIAVMPKGTGAAAWVEEQVELFKHDGGHLRKLFKAVSDSPSVLIIDQFEEVFTLCNDEELLEGFVRNLLGVLAGEGARHRVILTMRIEFQEQMPRLDALYDLFKKGLVQVVPLSAADLRDAIEKPAAEVGLKFDKGIVDSLVKEIVGEPAGLPLLQFTLLELWRRRKRNRVTEAVYYSLGGARKALTNVASAVYGQLNVQDQVVAKRIFLRLAWAGEGVEVLRNRVRRKDLHKIGGAAPGVDEVLRKLVAARLVRLTRDEFAVGDKESPDDQFEVAHEALIRNWQLLINWLQAEHETLRQRIRLRSAAEQWKAHGKDSGGLLGGSLLADASKYTDLDELEKEFLKASRDAEEAATREREETRQREVAQLQALAAAKSRAARRLWYFAAVLTIGLLLTGGALIFAVEKRNEAIKQQTEAIRQAGIAERLATDAKIEKDTADKLREAAIKREEYEVRLRKEAETQTALASKRETEAEQAKRDAIAAQAVAVRAKNLASSQAGVLALQKAQLEKLNGDLTEANKLAKANAAIAEGNAILANAKAEEYLKQKEKTEEALAKATENLKLAQDVVTNLEVLRNSMRNDLSRAEKALTTQTAFSADATRVVTFSAGEPLRVWNTRTGDVIQEIKPGDELTSTALSANGRLFVTANSKGDIALTDIGSGQSRIIPGVLPKPRKLILSADSQRLAVLGGESSLIPGPDIGSVFGAGSSSVKVIDLKTGESLASVMGNSSPVLSVAFSQNGQLLALTGFDGQTKLAKLGGNKQLLVGTLSTGGCRPGSFDLVNFNPSPDLKARLHFETICPADSSPSEIKVAAKALTLDQSKKALGPATNEALKPADKDKKAAATIEGGQEDTREAVENTLRKDEKSASQNPDQSRKLPGGQKTVSIPENWSIRGANRQPLEVTIAFDVYKRVADGSFTELGSFEINSSKSGAVGDFLQSLNARGVSGDQIRAISTAIIDFANKMAELNYSDPKDKTAQAQGMQLVRALYRRIMEILGVPWQAIS